VNEQFNKSVSKGDITVTVLVIPNTCNFYYKSMNGNDKNEVL